MRWFFIRGIWLKIMWTDDPQHKFSPGTSIYHSRHPPPHITNVQERFWPLRFPMFYYRKGGGWRPGWRPQFIGVPGLIFFPWIICKHDFKPNPSDRELFYDIPTNWPFYVNSLFHSFFVVYSLSLVSVPAPKLQIYITFHDYFFYYTPYCF